MMTITVNGDDVDEGNQETFTVTLSNAPNANITDGQGVGTITDDDESGLVIVESNGNTNATEGEPGDGYTVMLTSQPDPNVTVTANPDAQTGLGNGPGVAFESSFNGSLGFRVVDMSDSPTCWGRGGKDPQQVGESNTLTPRNPKEPLQSRHQLGCATNCPCYSIQRRRGRNHTSSQHYYPHCQWEWLHWNVYCRRHRLHHRQ